MYNNLQDDPTGATFFNDLLDMGMQQQEVAQDDEVLDEQPVMNEDELPDEFIQGLSEYAKETEDTDLQSQIDELREQLELSRVDSEMAMRNAELEERLMMAEFYQTPEGEDALMAKYEPRQPQAESAALTPRYVPIADAISKRESGGNYKAFTSAGGGEGAVGKYQFRWAQHKDWITKLTGVKSIEEFKNSPEAQEKAFAYWEQTTLTPTAIDIQKELAKRKKQVPSVDEIKKKVHFAGAKGAKDYYIHGKETTDAFGTKTSTYKMGGKRKYKC